MEALPDAGCEYVESPCGGQPAYRVKRVAAKDANEYRVNTEATNVDVSKRAHSVVSAVAKAAEDGLRAERVGPGRYEAPSRSRPGRRRTVRFSAGRASCDCPSRTTCAHIGAALLLIAGAYD